MVRGRVERRDLCRRWAALVLALGLVGGVAFYSLVGRSDPWFAYGAVKQVWWELLDKGRWHSEWTVDLGGGESLELGTRRLDPPAMMFQPGPGLPPFRFAALRRGRVSQRFVISGCGRAGRMPGPAELRGERAADAKPAGSVWRRLWLVGTDGRILATLDRASDEFISHVRPGGDEGRYLVVPAGMSDSAMMDLATLLECAGANDAPMQYRYSSYPAWAVPAGGELIRRFGPISPAG